jgi:hypothetical protein
MSTHLAYSQAIPKPLIKLFPPEQSIKAIDSCDINKDGIKDYLLAFGFEIEETDDPRTLFLFVSAAPDSFRVEFQSANTLYGALDGPYAGHENLSSIQLQPNIIGVHYYAGMTTRWSESHIFQYDSTSGDWFLTKVHNAVDNIYDDIDPEIDSTVFSLKDSIFISNSIESIYENH